ncbi:MAG: hypothetical protein SGI71_13830 [Verrucomicrobiota bacterium]|nr:hypothetical protein [Verrucomicrobiota bacterium]
MATSDQNNNAKKKYARRLINAIVEIEATLTDADLLDMPKIEPGSTDALFRYATCIEYGDLDRAKAWADKINNQRVTQVHPDTASK